MFVRLVVVDDEKYEDKWEPCSGGSVYVIYDEQYQRDDNREPPSEPAGGTFDYDEEARRVAEYESYHFPRLHERRVGDEDPHRPFRSRPYLAAILLGATGWSGWSDEAQSYWYCTYDSLTDEGRQLYQMMERLYPGRKIHLQTWLDT